MSVLDRSKAQITYLQSWLTVLIVTDASLFGWVALNVRTAPAWLLICGIGAFLVVTVSVGYLHRRIQRLIDTLREL